MTAPGSSRSGPAQTALKGSGTYRARGPRGVRCELGLRRVDTANGPARQQGAQGDQYDRRGSPRRRRMPGGRVRGFRRARKPLAQQRPGLRHGRQFRFEFPLVALYGVREALLQACAAQAAHRARGEVITDLGGPLDWKFAAGFQQEFAIRDVIVVHTIPQASAPVRGRVWRASAPVRERPHPARCQGSRRFRDSVCLRRVTKGRHGPAWARHE